MGPDRKQAQHPPPPQHALAPSLQAHGDRGPSGSGRRATSMLGSGTHMVTQQVVLLSHTSEQVDPSTTLPPPPPACAPDGRGARSRRPQGLKSGGCEGLTAWALWVSLERPAQGTSRCARAPPTSSQTPRPAQPRALQCSCGRPLEARQPPVDPCPPPPPSSTERPFGCGALWAPSSTRAVAPQPVQPALVAPRAGKHTLRPGAPPPAQGTPSAVGAGPSPRGSTTCA